MTATRPVSPIDGGREQTRRRVTLRWPAGRSEFFCQPDEPILYGGLRHGLNLPYECATGTCGACRLRGAADDVRLIWPEAPGWSKLKAERELLLCQSVAARACEVETPSTLAPWPPELPRPGHYRGQVTARRMVACDVLAFTIALDQPMAFAPGQFVVLQAPAFAGYRAYSMLDVGEPARGLSFVIRRKEGGAASRWLFADSGERAAVRLFGPLGRAVLRPDEDANLLVVAGSTGIAGPLAILRKVAAGSPSPLRRADVFFGVRTLADAFLLEPLAELVQSWPRQRLAVTLALSDEPAPGDRHPTYPAIGLANGTVDAVVRRQISGPRPDTIAFVAGSPPMVDAAIRALLRSVRFPANRIRYDRFW